MREIVLIHVSGLDRPGLMHALTAKLAAYGVDILDLGQSVIHETLALSILINIPVRAESAPILKELLFLAHEKGVSLTFTPVDDARYAAWVAAGGKQRYIVTLVARRITADQVSAVSAVLAQEGLNIDFAHRLSGRDPLSGDASARACVELSVRGTPRDETALRRAFLAISAELGVDIAFQEDDLFRRNRRLVAFDMDSTLIQAEVIDELAKAAGVGREVCEITEQAMRGELDFQQSLKRRLCLLEGLPEAKLAEIAEQLPLSEGTERLITGLKRLGYTIAIISGGFTYFGRRLQERLGIDYVYANELEVEDGKLTGRVTGRIVDAARKAEILAEIAAQERIDLKQVIAVGDGANDLPMLSLAGLGIAFHAKPVVRAGARQAISNLGLDAILYLIGVHDRELDALPTP